MTICIFDLYFSTLGGGEKHIGYAAEILTEKHQVYILHCGAFNKADIKSRLNLNLDKVTFINLDADSDPNEQVIRIAGQLKAPVFINATHFSKLYIPGLINISLVFFPRYIYPTSFSAMDMIKYKMASLLFGEYVKKIAFDKISHDEEIDGGLGRWTYKASDIIVNGPFTTASVFYEGYSNRSAKEVVKYIHGPDPMDFTIDDQKISFRNTHPENIHCKLELGCDTFVPAEKEPGSQDTRALGLFITQVKLDSFSLLTKMVLKLWRTGRLRSHLTRLYIKGQCIREQLAYKDLLLKGDLILSNSAYTKEWIGKIYGQGIETDVLYPPVDVNEFYSKDKNDQIISVGRFFVGDHNKKQLELIKAFKRLYDNHPEARSYTFHLCGGTHKEERNVKYVELCRKVCQGYPIMIHTDIKYDQLKELYAGSKIFWHGAGLHEDEQKTPDKFEHFGITTVESMASGCVPIVIGIAGQLEIVQNNVDGFHWKTEEELINRTLKVMRSETLRSRLSAASMERAKNFDQQKFRERLSDLFRKVNVSV